MDGNSRPPARAQIAAVQNDDIWTLANDYLQRWQLSATPDRRLAVPSQWRPQRPLHLGTPLQPAQADGRGGTLFLGTQLSGGRTTLATAVDAEDGRIHWQRQVGLLCRQDPLLLGRQLLVLDEGQALFLFDPARHPVDPEQPWQFLDNKCLANPPEEGPGSWSHLFADTDGTRVWAIGTLAQHGTLAARCYEPSRDDKPLHDYRIDLADRKEAALAGTLAARGNTLLMPLDDGTMIRVTLKPGGKPLIEEGPFWRERSPQPGAQGHVVWLNDEVFVTTNGDNGLTSWRWPAKGACAAVKEGTDSDQPAVQLPAPIVAAPLLLPPQKKGQAAAILVADEQLTLHLLRGPTLQEEKLWALKTLKTSKGEPLKGKLTAGPFLRGRNVGCVVNRRVLVWLDPTANEPLTYEIPDKGTGIVGQPVEVEDMIIVADEAGFFVGLDPITLGPRGPGYPLQAQATPTASPAPFGQGRAFAPLSDGTVFLLPLSKLRGK
jgi:hypothetical protein